MKKKAIPKDRRMVLLYRLQQVGVLESLSLSQLGDILHVSRPILLRDLMDLEKAEAEFQELMKARPWEQGGGSGARRTPEVDEAQVAENIEEIKRLTRDGMMWLQNMSGLAVHSHWAEEDDGGGELGSRESREEE